MSSSNPPYPYYNGITYNSAFFTTESGSGLTVSQANAKYLQKTVADTATVLETFTNGIKTNTLSPLASSGTLDIGNTSNSIININNSTSRTGSIFIGSGNTSQGVVRIGGGDGSLNTIQIMNGTYTTGQTAGNVNIASGPFDVGALGGTVNIGRNTRTAVYIGGINNSTEIFSGTVKLGTVNDSAISVGTYSLQTSNILIGTKGAVITGTDKIVIGGATNTLTLSSGTININSPLTLNYSYSPLPTINMLGYSFSNTTSFLTPASPVVGTLVCYSPIQYLSLPAGLYHIQYYGSTGGATTYFYASIGVIGGSTTIVSGTTTFSAVATYGVSMWNGTTPTQAGRASTHFSNSAIIQLDGTQGVCVGYVSGTAGLTFNSGITAYRIA